MNSRLLNRTLAGSTVILLFICIAIISTAFAQESSPQNPQDSSQADTGNSNSTQLSVEERLEQLSDIEKRNLAERKERFDRLPGEEKSRLRALQAELEKHPENERLKEVMLAYTQWLDSLSAKQIAELQETPLKERIEQIRKLKLEQEEQRFKQLVELKLSSEDIAVLVEFMGDFAVKHKEEILAKIPQEWSHRFDSLDESRQRKFLMMGLMGRDGKLRVDFAAQDIASLRGKLSSQEAIKAITDAKTPAKQAQLIRGWLRAAAMSRGRTSVSAEEMRRFYLNDLRPEHRDVLEKLSGEELQKKLRQYYFEYRFRRRPSYGRDRGPGRPREGGPREGGPREDGDGRRPPPRPDGPPRHGPPGGGPPPERREDDRPGFGARDDGALRGRPVFDGERAGKRLGQARQRLQSGREEAEE